MRCAVEILQSREDVEFLLVGAKEDPLLAGVLSEIRSLIGSRKSAIRLVPLVPDALPYYRASDIYVCASYEESFPRSILEAMAFGLPIAATPIFGIAEQITDGETGLFFDPGDTAGMRRQLELLLDDPTRGVDVGAKAELYRLMDQLCRQGLGIIVTSSELPELLTLSDRILVLCEGVVTAELDPQRTSSEQILRFAMPE